MGDKNLAVVIDRSTSGPKYIITADYYCKTVISGQHRIIRSGADSSPSLWL